VGTAKGEERSKLVGMLGAAERFGVGEMKASELLKKLC
jgi:hypothetical protein